MTKARLIEAFQRCRAAYGGMFQMPESGKALAAFTAVWADALADVQDKAGSLAFQQWCATSEAPPTPAAIRKLTQPALPKAAEGWEQAWELARTVGYGNGLVPFDSFSDPIAARAAQAVGWANLCGINLPTGETQAAQHIAFLRRDFLRIYDELLTGHVDREQRRIGGAFPPALSPKVKTIEGTT